MSIVIDEMIVEVQPEPAATSDGGPRPVEGSGGESLLELLALAQEREARLAID